MAPFVRLRTALACALLTVLTSGADARADADSSEPAPPPLNPAQSAQQDPSAPRMVNANQEVTKARQFFQERKFAEAAQALQRAYAFEPNPLFLFNAGQAYRKAELRKEALEMYQRYLEVDEKGPLAAEARGYVADLQALLKAQDRLAATQVELISKETSVKQTEEALEAEKKKTKTIEAALKKEKEKPFYKKPWFIVGASVISVGLLTTAGALGIMESLRASNTGTIKPSF
jgi:tetratricopeptide (TPR) repeat protein